MADPTSSRAARRIGITSTTICMVPITRFDFHTVGDGKPGPLYRRILTAWSDDVGVDIVAQARAFAVAGQGWSP